MAWAFTRLENISAHKVLAEGISKWTLKFEFRVMSVRQAYFSPDFFQPFKNVKAILSSWAVRKQAASCIWPAGGSG